MLIKFLSPNSPYRTEMDTEQTVVIENAAIGPVLVNGDFCVSLFARDGGFEGYAWIGDPLRTEIPQEHLSFAINHTGIHHILGVITLDKDVDND